MARNQSLARADRRNATREVREEEAVDSDQAEDRAQDSDQPSSVEALRAIQAVTNKKARNLVVLARQRMTPPAMAKVKE